MKVQILPVLDECLGISGGTCCGPTLLDSLAKTAKIDVDIKTMAPRFSLIGTVPLRLNLGKKKVNY